MCECVSEAREDPGLSPSRPSPALVRTKVSLAQAGQGGHAAVPPWVDTAAQRRVCWCFSRGRRPGRDRGGARVSRTCGRSGPPASLSALPPAALAPAALLQLLPEAGRHPLSPGRSPEPPAGARATRLPPPSTSPAPTPTASLPGTLTPPFDGERTVVAPSLPGGPSTPAPATCWHGGAEFGSGSRWTLPGCCEVSVGAEAARLASRPVCIRVSC